MPHTLHMVAAEEWHARPPGPWRPASLAQEGFAHCTDGYANLAATGNRHFPYDPRPFLILTIDLARLTSAWRYDDQARIYPHVYGPVDEAAIVSVQPFPRSPEGAFLAAADPAG